MTSITLAQILDAVEGTLATAPTLARSMSYDELTEGINDTPLLQVYPEAGDQDPTTANDRTTFTAGVRQTNITINCDYYAQQRKHLGEDMAALVDGIDAMTNLFEAQDTKPYFGLIGIKAFHWSWQRVIFDYGDPAIVYVGARFTLLIRVF
jgi:hypothetical protein